MQRNEVLCFPKGLCTEDLSGPRGGFREGSEGQAGRQAGRQGYNVFINAEFYSWDYNTDFNEKQFDTRRVFRQSGDLDPQWKKHEPNLTTLRKDRRIRF